MEVTHLFNQVVSIALFVRAAVNWKTLVVQLKSDLRCLADEGSRLETATTELLGKVIKDLDVVRDVSSSVLRSNSDLSQRLAVDSCLRIRIRKLGGGPKSCSEPDMPSHYAVLTSQ